jgi:hypothetical protein
MASTAWAYDFTCRRPIGDMRAAFDAAGPWRWQGHDSDFFGSYLDCRPQPQVRLRVHLHAEIWQGRYPRQRADGFLALLEIDEGSTASRAEIDDIFRRLLAAVDATDVTEIEPYD